MVVEILYPSISCFTTVVIKSSMEPPNNIQICVTNNELICFCSPEQTFDCKEYFCRI